MELADVLDSKSSGSDTVPVRPRSPAPNQKNPNQIFPIGKGFGFFVFLSYDYFGNGVAKSANSQPRKK